MNIFRRKVSEVGKAFEEEVLQVGSDFERQAANGLRGLLQSPEEQCLNVIDVGLKSLRQRRQNRASDLEASKADVAQFESEIAGIDKSIQALEMAAAHLLPDEPEAPALAATPVEAQAAE